MNPSRPAVILIETDEITLELYQRELVKTFTVLGFIELEAVIQTIADQEIAAIVIEPEVQAGRGWELIETIHATFPSRSIPVIVCSTRESSDSPPSMEISTYLTKPVLPGTLRREVLKTLRDRARAAVSHD